MAKATNNGKVKLGKRRLYSLITCIVIIIVIVAFAAYFLEPRTTIAKITQFSATRDGSAFEQVLYKFSVEVENQGTNDIKHLNLTVSILSDGIQIGGEYTILQSLLRGQRYASDDLGVWVNVTDIGSKTITFAATLELDNKTIDEVTLAS